MNALSEAWFSRKEKQKNRMEMNEKIIANESKKRFELEVEGYVAFIDYIKKNNKIFLVHTEVPEELKGKGVAARIVKLALEEIERRQAQLVPICPYVRSYLKRHPEWNRLVEAVNT